MRHALHAQVLEALVDTAFKARFDVDRITKERSAVVAEAQMMNTMEYRVDCALLRSLHRECSLGSRFPIGRVEQVGPLAPASGCRTGQEALSHVSVCRLLEA